MIDVIVRYELGDEVKEMTVTLDEWIENVEYLEDVILELVKEKVKSDKVELIEWETVRKDYDIYKITY